MDFGSLPSDLDALTALWNRSYEGYFVPVSFTAEHMRRHLLVHDIVVDASVGMYDGAAAVGVSLLGMRGDSGWIGGLGIVPTYRGRGLAAQLVAEQLARSRNASLRRVRLEVLVENWARKVYVTAGFREVRRLDLLSGQLRGGEGAAAPPAEIRLLLPHLWRHEAESSPAWQRQVATWWRGSRRDIRVVCAGPEDAPDGYAVFVPGFDGEIHVLDAGAVDEGAAASVVRGLARQLPRATVHLLNEPEGSRIHRALVLAGCAVTATQLEMEWDAG